MEILNKNDVKPETYKNALRADDGESLNLKFLNGEISFKEYHNELVKKLGFKNRSEYYNELAKRNGYKNNTDYSQKMRFERGIGTGLSMYENEKSSQYLGIVIAERILPKIFNDVKIMPNGNRGFDAICNRNLKIEVKSSSLVNNQMWTFTIKENKIADYFFMIGFDNRNDLKVMHMWLAKNDVIIEKTTHNSKEFILNEKQTVDISKGKMGLKRWEKHEITDKLDEVQKICDEFKNIEKHKKDVL